jgi:4-diphosphocytidyl-2-C-methyl-D-erythritol kinase
LAGFAKTGKTTNLVRRRSPVFRITTPMWVSVRSFAKINLGLRIGALRADGYHELRTVYQTIDMHDIVRVRPVPGSRIEIRCKDPRVPTDESNTCYRVAARVLAQLKARRGVVIEIEKRLPVKGGLGGASANGVATLVALEHALRKSMPAYESLRIAAEVGSDLPLFLIGGTVIGSGRGEEVYPATDLPSLHCVVATPDIGVSTPRAFSAWDDINSKGDDSQPAKLTGPSASDRMLRFSHTVSAWLGGLSQNKFLSGVPGSRGRGRAETPLLDLVRTGIENDFEQVVFPQYPALRQVKRDLERAGASYASLSGSGSAIYGLFSSRKLALEGAAILRKRGVPAQATTTLTRQQYWKKFLVSSF